MGKDLSLELFPARHRARRTDPETSHEAARSITGLKLRDTQMQVLLALTVGGPKTDEQIREFVEHRFGKKQSPSGLRTRRSELVVLGFVMDSGERATLPSGRKSIVWRITTMGVSAADAH